MKPGIRETWYELLPMLQGLVISLPLAIGFAALMVFVVLPWVWPDMAFGWEWGCWYIGGRKYCF